MLSTFVPSQGRLSGVVYNFPKAAQDQRAQRRRSTWQNVAKIDGAYLSTGMLPMPLDYGTVTYTFDLTPAWLKTNPNWDYYNGTQDDSVAIMNAILHFVAAVSEGGVGVLTDKLNAGVIDPATRSAITGMTAQAIIDGDLQVQKQFSHATLQATFGLTSGGWNLQPSNQFIALA